MKAGKMEGECKIFCRFPMNENDRFPAPWRARCGDKCGVKKMSYNVRICDPIFMDLVFMSDMLYTTISARRIQAVMEEKPLPEPETALTNKDYSIRFDKVNFAYKNTQVLFGISCDMGHGGMTALVGPSGSGKSTITRLIARFRDVDSGTISIGGVPVTCMNSEQSLTQISVVFQDVYLFHDTIAANIALVRPDAPREEVEAIQVKFNISLTTFFIRCDKISLKRETYDYHTGFRGR
jgi:ABC-type multidrug transport system fused ATPase/permease subunit